MAAADDLQTAYNQIAARIKEVTASASPNYSADGVSVSKADYLVSLITQLTALEQALQRSAGPFEVRSKAIP